MNPPPTSLPTTSVWVTFTLTSTRIFSTCLKYIFPGVFLTFTHPWKLKCNHFTISFFYYYFFNFKIFNSYMRSQTWTPLPPPSPQHLSGSSPCTSPKQAAPYVRHGLAIQFLHDNIHVIIPILPNHPTLSLSLWVQKSGIHICVFFPVLHTGSSLPSS